MRNCSVFLLATIGVAGLSMIAEPVRATVITQNFEVTVDGYYSVPSTNPSSPAVPPIGTKGYGTFTLDESQIKYNNVPTEYHQIPPLGYYILTPSNFSLDFFNHRYTQTGSGSNPSQYTQFLFDPTSGGGYQLRGFYIHSQDQTTGVDVSRYGSSYGNFVYQDRTDPVGGISAYGSVQLTNAEEVPEPSEVLGIPIAIAFCWLFQRKWASTKAANRK